MKTKPLFGFFLALFTVALVASFASAASLQLIGFNVEVDDTELGYTGQSIVAEDVLPLEVRFTADENASNVEVSAWIRGFRSETRVDKQIDDLVEGETSLLPTRLSVIVPSDLDDDDNELTTGRDMTLVVRVESDSGS